MKKSLDFLLFFRLFLSSLRLLVRLIYLYPLSLIVSSIKGSSPERKKGTETGGGGEPLVLYSQVAWWGVWQRPQEQAMGFARHRRVFFVSPVQIHEPRIRYTRWKRLEKKATGRGLVIFSPLIFSGQYRWRAIFLLNRLILLAEIRWLLRRERSVILFTNSPFVDYLLSRIRVSRVIYDIIDDFAAFEWAPTGAGNMEKRILKAADLVFTGTYSLYEKKRKLMSEVREADGRRESLGIQRSRDNHQKDALNISFVPCGVDFESFSLRDEECPGGANYPEPEDIRGLPRPIIGYTGTLSERIDTSILSLLARRFPSASLVLVGPVHRSLGDIPRAKNIHYPGLKKHRELPGYLHHFQIALLPFRLTEAALAINPVKTLEYLAAGCVVVSTAIPDVARFYSDVVLIASGPEDFVEKVRRVMHADNRERIKKGIELARLRSWENMVEEMERSIRSFERSPGR